MSYKLVFTTESEGDLSKLHPLVASKLLNQLDALELGDPYDLLTPWYYLYRPVSWYFRCKFDGEGRRWYFHLGIEVDPFARLVHLIYIGVQSEPLELASDD